MDRNLKSCDWVGSFFHNRIGLVRCYSLLVTWCLKYFSVDNAGLYFHSTPLCSASGFTFGVNNEFSMGAWFKIMGGSGSIITLYSSSGAVVVNL